MMHRYLFYTKNKTYEISAPSMGKAYEIFLSRTTRVPFNVRVVS